MINLYLGDSLEIIKNLNEESIDLILTDPPYNIADNVKLTKVGNKIKTNKEAWGKAFRDNLSFKNYVKWLREYFKEFYRILKNSGSLIMFLDRKYTGFFTYILEEDFNFKYRNKLYFVKNNPLPHFRKNNYRSTVEEAIWLTKGKNYHFNFLEQKEMRQVFYGNIGKKVSKHPTEKYSWMIEPIIRRHVYEGDIVLDPFMGSGVVGSFTKKYKYDFIGIDNKEEYYIMAKVRLNV